MLPAPDPTAFELHLRRLGLPQLWPRRPDMSPPRSYCRSSPGEIPLSLLCFLCRIPPPPSSICVAPVSLSSNRTAPSHRRLGLPVVACLEGSRHPCCASCVGSRRLRARSAPPQFPSTPIAPPRAVATSVFLNSTRALLCCVARPCFALLFNNKLSQALHRSHAASARPSLSRAAPTSGLH